MMGFVWGALAGIVWGAAAALLNAFISKKCLDKGTTVAMLLGNLGRVLVDIAALGSIFLLRNSLPFRYEGALVGTAISRSLVMIVCAYRLARPDK